MAGGKHVARGIQNHHDLDDVAWRYQFELYRPAHSAAGMTLSLMFNAVAEGEPLAGRVLIHQLRREVRVGSVCRNPQHDFHRTRDLDVLSQRRAANTTMSFREQSGR